MAIPAFDAATGVLPVGRHAADVMEIEARLVVAFAASSTRRLIFNWWLEHRKAVAEFIPVFQQWIDGSFVEAKNDPADVDLVTFFGGAGYDALPPHRKQIVNMLMANKRTQQFWQCDSYPVAVYPGTHPMFPKYLSARAYWDNWFGHTRSLTPKGYIEVL